MKIEDLQELVDFYIKELESQSFFSRSSGTGPEPKSTPLEHACWMLHRMDESCQGYGNLWADENSKIKWDKYNRWLGFVQGVLWVSGIYTIDQMREHVIHATQKDPPMIGTVDCKYCRDTGFIDTGNNDLPCEDCSLGATCAFGDESGMEVFLSYNPPRRPIPEAWVEVVKDKFS